MTVKTDDVTRVRKDVDPHGRFRGEWVKKQVILKKLKFLFYLVFYPKNGLFTADKGC